MRVAFAMFDQDGDGQISVQEVQDTMTSLGIKINLKEVKLIVRKVDTDCKTQLFARHRHPKYLYRFNKSHYYGEHDPQSVTITCSSLLSVFGYTARYGHHRKVMVYWLYARLLSISVTFDLSLTG